MKDFAKALEIKPNDACSLTMRAETYSRLGQFDLALADRSQVIELEPSTNHRYFEPADVYRTLGKFDLALADIEKGFATDAVKDATWFPRARAYALRGDIYAEELQKYNLAIKEYDLSSLRLLKMANSQRIAK